MGQDVQNHVFNRVLVDAEAARGIGRQGEVRGSRAGDLDHPDVAHPVQSPVPGLAPRTLRRHQVVRAPEQQAIGRHFPLPAGGGAAVVEEAQPLQGDDGLADGPQHPLVLEGTRAWVHGHGLGLEQGLHVRRQPAADPGPHGRQNHGLQDGESPRPGGGAGLAEVVGRSPEGGELLGGRGLEDAVQPRGNAEPDSRRIGDLFHLGEGLADGVAHALDRPPGNLQGRRHFVQGQAFRGRGEPPRQLKKSGRFFVSHANPARK